MPMVTIQVTREGSSPDRGAVTAEEKAALIKGVSQLLLDVLNKPLDATFVVIEEVPLENWGVRRPAGRRVSPAARGQVGLSRTPAISRGRSRPPAPG